MCLPVLNLLNFELPSANKCRYVLTSPRSLKACKRAGIKPVDLLYKSLSDVEDEIGSKDNAQILFEAYEAERQRKLALCRAFRNELLLNGCWSMKETNINTERHRRYSPKLHDSKNRALPIITESYLRKRAETPENMRKLRDRPATPRSYMNLPKVNVAFDNYRKEDIEKDITKNDIVGDHDFSRKTPYGRCDNDLSENNGNHEPSGLLQETVDGKNSHSKEPEAKDFDSVLNVTPSTILLVTPQESNEGKVISGNNSLQSEKFVSSEDINNNHIKIKKKRPTSARKKGRDMKKISKNIDQKKTFQNMKIQYSDPEYCTYKYKKVIENSVERDLRELDAQRVQRELEAGMERWQDRVLLLQWLDIARAREQASRELEIKVERLQQKSRAKNIIHIMNINKVKEAEDMKAEGLRRQVESKERKILTLQQEKERIINECKSRALSIQELRDQIRSIMTPETFDQKVSKLSMHKKVLDTHMCARIMQRSHIWLG